MENNRIMNKQSGFSLIELVIVIVILGLLAAAALPRFLDVTDEAKKASIKGIAGGFATAVLSARAQWEAGGRPQTDSKNVVDYDGTEFLLTSSDNGDYRDGYPIALYSSSASETTVSAGSCQDLMEELMQNPPSVDTDATSDPEYLASINSNTECTYTQQQNGTAHYFTYDVTQGTVTVTVDE